MYDEKRDIKWLNLYMKFLAYLQCNSLKVTHYTYSLILV